jgi:hypothetical protein
VGGAVDAVDAVLDCNAEARKCWRETRDLLSCQKSYNACLRS